MMAPTIRAIVCLAAAALVTVAGCAKRATVETQATPTEAATSAATESPGVAGTPTETPNPNATPTPNSNLLSYVNGAIVRSYPSGFYGDPATAAESGGSFASPPPASVAFVWELPGVATLSGISFDLSGGYGDTSSPAPSVTVAVSTSGADSGYRDLGSVKPGADDTTPDIPSAKGAQARWIRLTLQSATGQVPWRSVTATGTLAPRPAGAPITGMYYEIQSGQLYAGGQPVPVPTDADHWHLKVVAFGSNGGLSGEECASTRVSDAYPGTLSDRIWTVDSGDRHGRLVANDEGTLIVGVTNDNTWYFTRAADSPKACGPQTLGTGSNNVVTISPDLEQIWPFDSVGNIPKGFRGTVIGPALVDQPLLDGASTVILADSRCQSASYIGPSQGSALMDWVAAGHKFIIYNADWCSSPTYYPFLPFQFETSNPGAQGARGDRLIEVENDSLGTLDKTDKAHFFDPQSFVAIDNQLGDAGTVTAKDPHWCGHLFGTNVKNVNGFMQMYAPFGKGLIIYDGFDKDDQGSVPLQRIRMLELTEPIPPDLACTQRVSLAFLIQPSQEGSFVPGKATTLSFPMELLANQGWQGHVAITTSGDFQAAVTPNQLDVAGGTVKLSVAVTIPASAKPGTYAVIVNGDAGNGQTSQATITLNAAVPIVKQLKLQRRVRLYGIHFDVDKATIKPQSEPVIALIASIMRENPAWRFRVEGHTDSDGGMQHNVVLSQQRAQAVVNDLVKRYRIARSRLVPVGYSYTKPVASNDTPAGKALNRRVELFRL